ncbi:DUF916 domain-containing protein [Streptomyces bambusae]|uniref:DUF916 domain-containing protein n=1 Tax=Streptomyces bambusae TaxID=1550616 RepID=UPI001D000594|nr:DUF916 domain-containing protein [Streptomyces bambusae]MCB5169292.1 DUF916 domain-containing protein [Streptomyces bambusae]
MRIRTRTGARTAPRRHPFRGLVAGLLLGLPALLAGLVSPTGAAAAENGTWGVFPTPAAGKSVTDRAYFFHQGEAGAAVRDSVTLVNSSTEAITFKVFATDAVNTPVGGAFALLPVETRPRGPGTWVTLPPEVTGGTVTVPPKGRKDIPFTVRVPEDAAPGDHAGGIVALNTKVEGVRKDGQVKVGVRRSVGARLYLRVPGPLTPAVGVENVRVSRDAPLLPWTRNARATVRYTLVNHGNVVLSPQVKVGAEGLFGRSLLHRPARDLRLVLLPGQRVELTETWADAPQFDRATLRVTATATAYPDLSETGTATLLAVPWLALGLLAVLGGAAAAGWAVRRRRRRAEDDEAVPERDLAQAH